jgi:hypothetical protein
MPLSNEASALHKKAAGERNYGQSDRPAIRFALNFCFVTAAVAAWAVDYCLGNVVFKQSRNQSIP